MDMATPKTTLVRGFGNSLQKWSLIKCRFFLTDLFIYYILGQYIGMMPSLDTAPINFENSLKALTNS